MSDLSKKPTQWEERKRSVHADCRVFNVERRTFRHQEKELEEDFYVICPAQWAVAMARTPSGKWVLVRQFRFGSGSLSWEFPSGCAQPGEDLMAAAARELREESGYVGRDPVLLGTVLPNPAIQDNQCAFVYFRDACPLAPTEWDEHEELQLALLDEVELRAQVRKGTMTHALMLAGLALWDAAEIEQ